MWYCSSAAFVFDKKSGLWGFVYIGLKAIAKSKIVSRWIHRESTLIYAFAKDENQRKNRFWFSFDQCEWTLRKHCVDMYFCVLRFVIQFWNLTHFLLSDVFLG